MQTGRNLLFWAFGAMASSLLLSGLVSGAMMTALRVGRVMPDHGAVGVPMIVRYAITNRRRFLPGFGIHVDELPSTGTDPGWTRMLEFGSAWLLHVGPGETVHAEAVVVPRARGRAELRRLRAWTVFPFGLLAKSIELEEIRHVLVHPRVHRLRGDLLASIKARGTVGSRLSRQSGPGDDFHGLREYREGDSLRNIAWKRTADRDDLLTIERTRPDPPRIRVVLDLTRPPRPAPGEDPRRLEEDAIELAASIVHAAAALGFEQGLTVYGSDQPPIPVRRSERHRDRIMAALAAIDLEQERRPRPAPAGHAREAETAAVIVVHPDRVDLAAASPHAMHLSARQFERLVVDPPDEPPTASAPVGGGA